MLLCLYLPWSCCLHMASRRAPRAPTAAGEAPKPCGDHVVGELLVRRNLYHECSSQTRASTAGEKKRNDNLRMDVWRVCCTHISRNHVCVWHLIKKKNMLMKTSWCHEENQGRELYLDSFALRRRVWGFFSYKKMPAGGQLQYQGKLLKSNKHHVSSNNT